MLRTVQNKNLVSDLCVFRSKVEVTEVTEWSSHLRRGRPLVRVPPAVSIVISFPPSTRFSCVLSATLDNCKDSPHEGNRVSSPISHSLRQQQAALIRVGLESATGATTELANAPNTRVVFDSSQYAIALRA